MWMIYMLYITHVVLDLHLHLMNCNILILLHVPPPDVMHDCLEGVIPITIKCCINEG